MSRKIKTIFVSESIRRDSHAPLRYFEDVEPIHLYLNAPYGDMSEADLKGAQKVELDQLEQAIVDAKPDVIQGAEPFGSRLSFKLAQICMRAAKKSNAALIVPILENRPLAERFNLAQRAVLKLFCPGYFNQAKAIVFLNKGARTNVIHYAPKLKLVTGIVWGVWGVDTELFKPTDEKEKGSMIYAGRWIEDKGIAYMLEGFAQAKKELDYLSLKLCGQGPYEKFMRVFVEENKLTDCVEFIGQVKNTQLPKYFSQAELCIYPSITQKRWEEQVGTVNFQAMACETPVLTTKSGAIPEYLAGTEGAILVPERDAQAIAKGIINYFSDSNRTKIQKSARQFIMRYDIKGEIAKAEKLIKEVADV